MVTETQQPAIAAECREWHLQLVSYAAKIHQLQSELYYFAPGKTDSEILIGIEHFHNQFHIQLINIHELKHEIKHHLKETERHPNFGHRIPHHNIKEKLDLLLSHIDQLEDEFHTFIRQ